MALSNYEILTVVVFDVVFGFLTFAVAFGVTEIFIVHDPLAIARIVLLPLTEQIFFDLAATETTTFAPAGTESP